MIIEMDDESQVVRRNGETIVRPADPERLTLAQFLERYPVALTYQKAAVNPNMPDDPKREPFHHYYVTLAHDTGERGVNHMTLFYSKGPGLVVRNADGSPKRGKRQRNKYGDGFEYATIPAPPTVAEVLDCLASDAAGVENARDFPEWASEYGYDEDSRKAEKLYRACEESRRDLQSLLGRTAYDLLLWQTERE